MSDNVSTSILQTKTAAAHSAAHSAVSSFWSDQGGQGTAVAHNQRQQGDALVAGLMLVGEVVWVSTVETGMACSFQVRGQGEMRDAR